VATNLDIHNHNTGRKLNLHVQHCKTVLFKKNVMNAGFNLYLKVTDPIKLRVTFSSFKKDLKSFPLKIPFILLINLCCFNF
jgi:hypothetical protein